MNDLVALLDEKLEKFKWTGGAWAGSLCPFPDHADTAPSFRINLEKGFWWCFGCQRSGSMAELLRVLGLPPVRIDKLLKAIKFIREVREDKHLETLPEYILAAFRRCPKSLLKAGFTKRVLEDNDIGFDLTRYAITYPLRSKEGLLSAVYRRTEGEPKYLVYDFEDFDGYVPYPKKHLWGLHRVYARYLSGGSKDPLIVVEGFKACLWLLQHGYISVATMGTMMTKDQIDLLKFLDAPTYFLFDNDHAGHLGSAMAYKKLRGKIGKFRFGNYPKNKPEAQPDDLSQEELKKAIDESLTFAQWRRICRLSSKELRRVVLGRKTKS